MKFTAHFFLCVIALLFVGSIFATNAHAQQISSVPYQSPVMQSNTESDVPQDIRSTVQIVIIEMLGSFSCQLTGYNSMDLTHGARCLGVNPTTGKIGYVDSHGGALGMIAGGIVATYHIPLSSHEYIADVSQNFGLTKHAYAAQEAQTAAYTGFQTLSPLLPIWKVFRDLVYMFFVVIFIVIGLGIMFRFQIDARTVMSIQNQIPKIIISLLLVTFSYAIAGFLVDMMWVSTYLATSVMTNGTGVTVTAKQLTDPELLFRTPLQYGNEVLKTHPNSLSGVLDLSGSVGTGAQEVIVSLFDMDNWKNPLRPTCSLLNLGTIGGCVVNSLGDGVAFILGIIVRWVAFGAIFLIVAVTLVMTLIRIWFALIRAFVYILLDVVLAPFWILSGLLPGGAGIGPWLRDIVANLSAFPLTIILFLLGKIFIDSYSKIATPTRFIPPMIGDPGNPDVIAGIIGFAIVLITPEALTIAREQLKAPEFKYMATVGKALSSGRAAAGLVPGKMWDFAWKKNAYGQAKGPLALLLAERFKGNKGILGHVVNHAAGEWTKPEK